MKWNSRGYLSILYICPQFAICHQILWFIANCSFALALLAQVKKYPITFDFPRVADLATRKCSTDGFWISEDGLEAPDPSWTNFTGCFTADVAKVIDGYYGKNSSSMFWKHISLVSSNIFSTFQVISILWHIILVFSKWSDTVFHLYPFSHHSVFYQHLGT